MLNRAIEKRIQNSVLAALFLMTLIVTPWMNLDPVNLPKFLVLIVIGMFLFGLFVTATSAVVSLKKNLFLLVIAFIALALMSVVSNGFSFAQIFGAYGRNTGFLSYSALAILLLGAAVAGRRSFGASILYVLGVVSAVNMLYGLIQLRGLDPVDWINPYSPIVGTLGNPNFTSALLGMGALAVSVILFEQKALMRRVLLAALLLLMLFISYESDAIQGLGVFVIGGALIFYYKFVRVLHSIFRLGYIASVLFGAFLSVLGILQRGPLAPILYQDSVTYRGDYWRAGWTMTLEHPLFGVGMDQYGDWYRASRTLEATNRRGPEVTSNSAHNVFLDISSNGGFPLLICYLLILALGLRSAVRVLKRQTSFDFVGVGLVATWIGYIFQSLVSINQLGLAVWGWVLTGAIIGYEHYGVEEIKRKSKSDHQDLIPPKAVISGSLGLFIGVIVSIGPIYQDMEFRNSLNKSDARIIKSAALQWPSNTYYMDYAAKLLVSNKFEGFARELSLRSTELNPRNFVGWRLLYENPKATAEEKALALVNMKELDTYNPDLD